MPFKRRMLVLSVVLVGFFMLMALPGTATQQANLSEIGNSTATLYYYDMMNETKGAIVPMPDNPQQVNSDPARAAPGMYTFSHVPAGRWYYLEADHNGKKWYAIFYMEENAGTKTANVHIPPLKPVNQTAATSPSPLPSICPTPGPTISPNPPNPAMPVPSTGMTFTTATLAAAALTLLLIKKHKI